MGQTRVAYQVQVGSCGRKIGGRGFGRQTGSRLPLLPKPRSSHSGLQSSYGVIRIGRRTVPVIGGLLLGFRPWLNGELTQRSVTEAIEVVVDHVDE